MQTQSLMTPLAKTRCGLSSRLPQKAARLTIARTLQMLLAQLSLIYFYWALPRVRFARLARMVGLNRQRTYIAFWQDYSPLQIKRSRYIRYRYCWSSLGGCSRGFRKREDELFICAEREQSAFCARVHYAHLLAKPIARSSSGLMMILF